MKLSLTLALLLGLTFGCANTPDARSRLDLAESSLTGTCNSAFNAIELSPNMDPGIVRSIAHACIEGGMVILSAQSAADALEDGATGEEEAAALLQVREAIRITRETALRIVALIVEETR